MELLGGVFLFSWSFGFGISTGRENKLPEGFGEVWSPGGGFWVFVCLCVVIKVHRSRSV